MVFTDFFDKHKGSKFIVFGCGESAILAKGKTGEVVTIGVNDIERLLSPDYLLVVNDKGAFTPERWDWVERSKAKFIFTHLQSLQVAQEKRIVFKLGRYRPWVNLDKRDTIDFSNNSPYMAVILAFIMGASKIGVIGVDFTPNHFFAPTGIHPLTAQLRVINEDYNKLYNLFKEKKVDLVSLSPNSLLHLPKETIEEFLESNPDSPKIV